MYVRCHKLNNSYITYDFNVKCPKKSQDEISSSVRPLAVTKQKLSKRTLLAPLPKHTIVKHRIFGKGEVVSTDIYGYMSVVFAQKTVRFIYPEVFKNGFLVRV